MKESFLVIALAVQSLVVVILWTRLFGYDSCWTSLLKTLVRWSVPIVWIASIVLWQLLLGKRKMVGLALRTFAACAFAGAMAFVTYRFRPACIYVPAKIAMGEGGWSRPVGEAEMIVRGRRIVFEVRVGDVVYASLEPLNGLMLISKDPMPGRKLKLISHLVACRDELFVACQLSVLRIPLISDPTLCYGIVSLKPHGKIEIFDKLEMRDVDGMREYDCELSNWHGGGHVILRIPDKCFQLLKSR